MQKQKVFAVVEMLEWIAREISISNFNDIDKILKEKRDRKDIHPDEKKYYEKIIQFVNDIMKLQLKG
jgi:hypothetical protein